MFRGIRKKIEKKAGQNFPFLIAGLFGISSFACPCPFCYFGAGGSFLAGIAQKLGFKP